MRQDLACTVIEAVTAMMGEPVVISEVSAAPGQSAPRSVTVPGVASRGWDTVDSVSGIPLRTEDQVLSIDPRLLPFTVLNGMRVDLRGQSYGVTDSRTDGQCGLQMKLVVRQ